MTTRNDDTQLTLNIPPPPFPPIINAQENLTVPTIRSNARSPNAFFVYRKAFTKHLLRLNYHLPMTEVSKFASTYWQNEPEDVKEVYKKLAREVKQELDRIRRNPQHSLMYISIMTPGDVMDSSKHSFTDANVTWDPAPNDCNISESSNSSDHYLPGRDQELYGESALDWYLRDVIP